jgi:hypothetical protein
VQPHKSSRPHQEHIGGAKRRKKVRKNSQPHVLFLDIIVLNGQQIEDQKTMRERARERERERERERQRERERERHTERDLPDT